MKLNRIKLIHQFLFNANQFLDFQSNLLKSFFENVLLFRIAVVFLSNFISLFLQFFVPERNFNFQNLLPFENFKIVLQTTFQVNQLVVQFLFVQVFFLNNFGCFSILPTQKVFFIFLWIFQILAMFSKQIYPPFFWNLFLFKLFQNFRNYRVVELLS